MHFILICLKRHIQQPIFISARTCVSYIYTSSSPIASMTAVFIVLTHFSLDHGMPLLLRTILLLEYVCKLLDSGRMKNGVGQRSNAGQRHHAGARPVHFLEGRPPGRTPPRGAARCVGPKWYNVIALHAPAHPSHAVMTQLSSSTALPVCAQMRCMQSCDPHPYE